MCPTNVGAPSKLSTRKPHATKVLQQMLTDGLSHDLLHLSVKASDLPVHRASSLVHLPQGALWPLLEAGQTLSSGPASLTPSLRHEFLETLGMHTNQGHTHLPAWPPNEYYTYT